MRSGSHAGNQRLSPVERPERPERRVQREDKVPTMPYRSYTDSGNASFRQASRDVDQDRSTTAAPPIGSSTDSMAARPAASLLRAMQEENDTLRSQLLRTERARDRATAQLETAMTQLAASQTAVRQQQERVVALTSQLDDERRKGRTAARATPATEEEQCVLVAKLRERCQQLADRLLATVRDQQVSQASEVYFFLRTQQEERSLICCALENLLEELGVETDEERAARQRNMYEGSSGDSTNDLNKDGKQSSTLRSGIHAGAVSQLAMMVTDAVQTRTAWAKLEKARARLALEQAAATVQELQVATERVTRAVFTTSASLTQTLDATAIEGGAFGEEDDADVDADRASNGLVFSGGYLRRPQQQQQQQQQQQRGHGHHHNISRGSPPYGALGDSRALLSRIEQSTLLTSRLSEAADGAVVDLDWCCDALKACVKGLAHTQAYLTAAREALEVRPPKESGAWPNTAKENEKGTSLTELPLSPGFAATASPEMAQLLESVLRDLRDITQRGMRERESITRRLAREVQQHYDTAKQCEQRIRMLEMENTKLVCASAKALTEEAEKEQRSRGKEDGVEKVKEEEERPSKAVSSSTPLRTRRDDEAELPSPYYPSSAAAAARVFAASNSRPWSWRFSSIDDRRSISPPERQGVAFAHRNAPLFPAHATDHRGKPAHGRAGGGIFMGHPYAHARLELSRDGGDPSSVSSTSGNEVEASPLDVRGAGRECSLLMMSSSSTRRSRNASILSPEPVRGSDREAAAALASSSAHRHLSYRERTEGKTAPQVASAPFQRVPAAADTPAAPLSGRDVRRGTRLSPRRHRSRSPPSEHSITEQKATSPYVGQDSADSTVDIPSPPPKPAYEGSRPGVGGRTLTEAALAERLRPRLADGVRGTLSTTAAMPPLPPSPRAREGTAAPQRLLTSPERGGGETHSRQRPPATARRLASPGSSGSGSGSKADLISHGSDNSGDGGSAVMSGQKTPEVWKRIRESGGSPPRAIVSTTNND